MMTLDEFKQWIEYFKEQAGTGGGGAPPHAVTKGEDWTKIASALGRASEGSAAVAKLMTDAATAGEAPKKDLDTCRESVLDRRFDADDLDRRAKVLRSRADEPDSDSVVEEEQIKAAKAWLDIAAAEIKVREELASITRAIAKSVDQSAERAHVKALIDLVAVAQKKETSDAVTAAKAAAAIRLQEGNRLHGCRPGEFCGAGHGCSSQEGI